MKLTIEKETERIENGALFLFGHTMARGALRSEVTLPELREKITALVAQNAVAMVQCAIDGVLEEGQYQAIKYLFEMVGLYPSTAGENDVPEDTLAKVLLRHLGVDENESQAGPRTGHETQVHPVE